MAEQASSLHRFSVFFLLLLMIVIASESATADTVPRPFFLMGDGYIHIRNSKSGEEARVNLLHPDGSLNRESLAEIDKVFGFPTGEKEDNICPRLIFMLDYFSDLVAHGKAINIESGYRSPEYNANLRNKGGNVAKTSMHMDGKALDFNIEGVNGRELWELIKSRECCGVGHYGGANVHLDSGRPRFWEASTSKVRTGESDFNRYIYLSTEYDRYRPGDRVRLSFSSVSDFGFGISRAAAVVEDSEGQNRSFPAWIHVRDDASCELIADRDSSRFVLLELPPDLHAGRYRIHVDFCNRPFEQMPMKTVSNQIELIGKEMNR